MANVAIIGGGPCGMSLLSAFRSAERSGEKIPNIVCFEKQSSISGLWNYSWKHGSDEHGEYVHNSMYRTLWSNGPKECSEMADYTFEEHFGKAIPSYPPRAVLQDYLLGKAKKHNISEFVRSNTVVRTVKEKGDRFTVSYEDLVNKTHGEDTFDYVVVATGHYSVPHIPIYPGIDQFPGRVLHSHDFRNAEEFKDQTIVLLGSSYSAEDIALQCYKYGAKKCIISYRSKPMGYNWPEQIKEVPQLQKIEGKTFHFADGSSINADSLIMCTGYQHFYPFLSERIKLSATNHLYIDKLYKGVIFEDNHKLIYLGAQDQYYTFTLFDVQAWFARDFILGKIKLPNVKEMKADMESWMTRFSGLTTHAEEIDFQSDYIKDLLRVTNYPQHDVDKMNAAFKQWKDDKRKDILTYRDIPFTSVITGTPSPEMKVAWLKAMDSSLNWFVNESLKINVESKKSIG
ncbi:uncharacterized protein LOC130644861 [Hydractinia symbiolongicarpus]|uniref:uncharacterized protein LOC130644861 n=1 Tax=Hydractinia symbiolongicarpus TaxID=13093 RepID=UPI00255069BA|nr:uncharacterized protein LOC130644861 [Hydractinia symbiolongicarpus]